MMADSQYKGRWRRRWRSDQMTSRRWGECGQYDVLNREQHSVLNREKPGLNIFLPKVPGEAISWYYGVVSARGCNADGTDEHDAAIPARHQAAATVHCRRSRL